MQTSRTGHLNDNKMSLMKIVLDQLSVTEFLQHCWHSILVKFSEYFCACINIASCSGLENAFHSLIYRIKVSILSQHSIKVYWLYHLETVSSQAMMWGTTMQNCNSFTKTATEKLQNRILNDFCLSVCPIFFLLLKETKANGEIHLQCMGAMKRTWSDSYTEEKFFYLSYQ